MPIQALVVVIVALFTDGFLYGLIIPLTPRSPARITEDWMLGLTAGSYAVGVILATLIFGLISNRLGRRRLMLGGAFMQLLTILIFANTDRFAAVLLARGVQGVAAAATWMMGLALVAQSFTRNRAQMMGFAILGNTLGLVLGPAVGGFLYDQYGFRSPFFVALSLLGIDGFLRWNFVFDEPNGCREKSELSAFLTDRFVLIVSVVVVLGAWCWSLLESILPNHLGRITHASSSSVGLIFTLSSLIYGLSCPWIGRFSDRYGSTKTMMAGLAMMALILPFLVVPTSSVGIGILLSLLSIAYAFAMNPTLSELGSAVDRRGGGSYAAAYAMYNIAYSVGTMSSDLTSSILSSAFSLKVSLLFTALTMLTSLPLAYFFRPVPAPVENRRGFSLS